MARRALRLAKAPKKPAVTNLMRWKQLLAAGYFPPELPPPFTTEEFASALANVKSAWTEAQAARFWSAPEEFDVPKFGHGRRKLAIVNPVSQFYVAQVIANNWAAIGKVMAKSKVSDFQHRILFRKDDRAVNAVDFDTVGRRKAEILATYGRYVKTDIARFYGSVYTHAIPWAVVGKATAKKKLNIKKFKQHYSSRLDALIRAGQSGQTIGIPIGPDTSRVISEMITSRVEEAMHREFPDFEKTRGEVHRRLYRRASAGRDGRPGAVEAVLGALYVRT